MEDRIGMATKHQITLRFRDEYAKASKRDKSVILDRMCETLGIDRSTAKRRLTEALSGGSVERRRTERPRRYSDRSRQLLREVWVMMDMPCGKYLKAMLPQWLPVLRACGELDGYDGAVLDELMATGAATVDRYLRPVRNAARPKGLASTRPAGRAAAQLDRDQKGVRRAGRPSR